MSDTAKYITLTAENFETEVINSSQPVVVDFWAAWCGPCRIMNPAIAQLAEDFEGAIKVGKLNIDDGEALATKYRIDAIPALVFFEGGEVVDRLVGVAPKQVLVDKVNGLLNPQPATTEKVA